MRECGNTSYLYTSQEDNREQQKHGDTSLGKPSLLTCIIEDEMICSVVLPVYHSTGYLATVKNIFFNFLWSYKKPENMSQDTLFFKESCIVISINITGTGALCVT
jgi:hypothetical protein